MIAVQIVSSGTPGRIFKHEDADHWSVAGNGALHIKKRRGRFLSDRLASYAPGQWYSAKTAQE